MEKFFLNVCRLCGLKLLGLLLLFSSPTAIIYGASPIEIEKANACSAIMALTHQAIILETAGMLKQTLDMKHLWTYCTLLQKVYFGKTSDTPHYPEEAYECFESIEERFKACKSELKAMIEVPFFKECFEQYRSDVEAMKQLPFFAKRLEQYKEDTKARWEPPSPEECTKFVTTALLFSRYFETFYALVLGNFAERFSGDPQKISAVQKAREPFVQVISTESETDSRIEDSEEIKTNKKILLEEALLVRVKNFDESDWKELAAMVSHVELTSDSWVFSHEFSHEFLQNIKIYRTKHPEVGPSNDIDFCRAVSYFITQYHPTPEYPKIEAKIRQQQEKKRILDSISRKLNQKGADGEIIDWHKLVEQAEKTINPTIIEIIAQKWFILEHTKQTDTELTLPEQDIRLLASTLYQVLHEEEVLPAEYFHPVLSKEFFNFLANLCEEKLKLNESAPASPQSSKASKNTPLEERYVAQLYAMILAYYQGKIEGTSDAFGDISGRLDRLNGKFANRDSFKQSLLESLLESALSCNVQALTECEFTKIVTLQELLKANAQTEEKYNTEQEEYIKQAEKEKEEAEILLEFSKRMAQLCKDAKDYADKANEAISRLYQTMDSIYAGLK